MISFFINPLTVSYLCLDTKMNDTVPDSKGLPDLAFFTHLEQRGVRSILPGVLVYVYLGKLYSRAIHIRHISFLSC